MTRFIRFTLLSRDPRSKSKTGVLVAAHELRDEGELSNEEHRQLRSLLRWFNEQLKIPRMLGDDQNVRAISWFKPEATEPLRRLWELKQVLDFHGINVEVHETTDPGIVIYEDGWQVVAKPRRSK